MVGFVLWAALFAGMVVLEGISLSTRGKDWPSLSDLLRAATRPVFGRWIMLAFWLWLGWHMFIRGWPFFLRGKGAGEPPKGGGGGKSAGALLGQVVLPLVVLYGSVAAMLIAGWRRRRSFVISRSSERQSALAVVDDRGAFLRYAVVTIFASYAVFLGAMAVYQLLIGPEAGGIAGSALTGGAFMAFALELPVFVVLSVLWSARWRHRHP
jgi:hypothetical protein